MEYSFRNPLPGDVVFFSGATEVMRLDDTGMVYKGQRIEDSGEAHTAFLETMKAMKDSRIGA